MASIQAWIRPTDDIEVRSHVGPTGAYAMFRIDGVDVWVSDPNVPAENRDAGIVATANMLIGVLTGLRDAAAGRIAATLPDGVEFIGTVGQFLDGIEVTPGELMEAFGK